MYLQFLHCLVKQQSHTINLTARKNFVFFPWFEKQKPSGIMNFWIGGKNCVKNEKYIVFLKSRYVNSNPGTYCLQALKGGSFLKTSHKQS